jgi:hypothetical protein
VADRQARPSRFSTSSLSRPEIWRSDESGEGAGSLMVPMRAI